MFPSPVPPRWALVGAAVVIVSLGMGALFSFGVFLKPIQDSTGWSRTAISWVASLTWIFNGIGAIVCGALASRYGAGIVAVVSAFLLGLGFVLSSQAATLWQLDVAFGVLVGFASGGFYAPLAAAVTAWFTTNRGIAVGTVSAGMGIGTLVMAPAARVVIDLFDWRTAMLIIGDLSWLVIIPVALLVLRAEPNTTQSSISQQHLAQDFALSSVFRSRQFWMIAVAHFICCSAHSGPLFHMVTHALDQGVAALPAATLLGVAGLSSVFGRILFGAVADRLGAKRLLVFGLGFQALVIWLFLSVGTSTGFSVLAVVFGVAYGGVMPLYALVLREYFGTATISTAYGAVYGISSLGMGLGSLAGGWFYDALGSYQWLFVSSAALGLMGMVVALALTPPRLPGYVLSAPR